MRPNVFAWGVIVACEGSRQEEEAKFGMSCSNGVVWHLNSIQSRTSNNRNVSYDLLYIPDMNIVSLDAIG